MNLMHRSQIEDRFIDQKKISKDIMTLDCDATKDRQYAKKKQRIELTFENYLSLDTQNIYDELGFQYHIGVRPEATHSSKGADLAVSHTIRQIQFSSKFKDRKIWVRADSGYYGAQFINRLLAVSADVVVRVPKNPGLPKVVGQIHNWQAQDPNDEKRIKFYDGRDCEIGSTNYRMTGLNRRLRYVVMRAKKKAEGTLFESHVEYDYFAFCTTLDEL